MHDTPPTGGRVSRVGGDPHIFLKRMGGGAAESACGLESTHSQVVVTLGLRADGCHVRLPRGRTSKTGGSAVHDLKVTGESGFFMLFISRLQYPFRANVDVAQTNVLRSIEIRDRRNEALAADGPAASGLFVSSSIGL